MAQNPDSPLDDGRVRQPRIDAGHNRVAPEDRLGGKGSKDDKAPVALRTRGQEAAKRRRYQEVLARARKRFDRAVKAEDETRKAGLDDDKFYYGEQWPADIVAQRNAQKRPIITVNKLPTFVHQVTNDQRQNRPEIHISPVGDRTDKEAARIYGGLIRADHRESFADIAFDTAFESAARKGWGYWRYKIEFEPKSFRQRVRIKRIRNAFGVYLDPDRQEPDGSDSKWGFLTEMIPRDDFKDMYPEADPMMWPQGGIGDAFKLWIDQSNIRIAEYFELEYDKRNLLLLSNGWTGWEDDVSDSTWELINRGDLEIMDEREDEVPKVHWYFLTVREVLEERDWPGKWVPIVEVVGEEIDIEGKVRKWGIVRQAKDAQRMYNYWCSAETQHVALSTMAKVMMAAGQDEGFENEWKQAHTDPSPVVHYNQKDLFKQQAPPPIPLPPPATPQGIVTAKQGAAQDMMTTTGIRFDATLGERLYDESGRALRELQRKGDMGAFHYVDNFTRSLRHGGEIHMDLLRQIMDTKQVATILREDLREEQIQVDPHAPADMREAMNPLTKKKMPVFNPTIGEYGVTVTIGASYATKRLEAVESMMDFAKAMPNAGALIMDLIAKNQDWPGAEEIATRLAKAIPPQFLAPEMRDVPPQVQALIQSLDTQVKQLTVEKTAAMQQLMDKQADRAQRQDSIDKDFEAKLIKIVSDVETKMAATQQKAETSFLAHVGTKLEVLGESVNLLREVLDRPSDTKH